MTETAKLAGAAHVIAEALEPLTPDQRKRAIDVALMLCPKEAVEQPKQRKPRSDRGTSRKAEATKLPGVE